MKSRFSLTTILELAAFFLLALRSASCSEFTIFSFKSGSLDESDGFQVTSNILSQNADVVCIQEVVAETQANDFYEVLKDQYAHFVYIPQAETNTLIASKFYIDESRLNVQEDQDSLSHNPLTNSELKPTLSATSIAMPGNRIGLRTLVKLASFSRRLTAQKIVLVPIVSKGGNDSGGAGASGRVSVDISFGGSEGTQVDFSASGEAHDGKGNFVSGRGEYNVNTGEGRIGISGGTISEKD